MPAYAETISASSHEATSDARFQKPYQGFPKGQDVVVTGMSGRFPSSSSLKEFEDNLFKGVDMVTEDASRWTPGLHGLPTRSGKIPDLTHFDAAYFSVSPRQAHTMDPQLRLLLEVCHEAIMDAGCNKNELRGKRIGVYVGVSGSETEDGLSRDPDNICGYELTGCCRAMFANRLSYAFDFKGPSFAVDTACSSSLVAFQAAWSAIVSGEIEGAIVAGSNLTLKPQSSMQFNALNMLSKDGKCKVFDSKANGYVRSEAVVAVFLQPSICARRCYGEVVHARTNTDGYKNEGITFPSGDVQRQLLEEVYEKSEVDPGSVFYVEAHGTGTKAGDPQEINALAEVMCRNRTKPLLVGSVKSNMGHSEPASGLCGLVKVLLAIQHREIPANLHFYEPHPDILPLNDGRMKVVSENIPWTGEYAAINCFGFGGANVHVLVRAPGSDYMSSSSLILPDTQINDANKQQALPRLLTASARTEGGVQSLLAEVASKNDINLNALVDHIFENPVPMHTYRGFCVVSDSPAEPTVTVMESPAKERPLWLVYSGMGSQWKGCGKALMNVPVFAAAIEKCRKAVLPLGMDVLQIITQEDPDLLQTATAAFTVIAAVQVGLTDILRTLGVIPKVAGMLGHSVGELGCAYADDALTAEQTVLSAYWRGRAVEEASLPVGAMAAVGLGAEEAEKFCGSSSVVVACHNAKNSVTISGPTDDVQRVQSELSAKEIFCRAVASNNIAFHHPTMQKAAPRLQEELDKIIVTPKRRSSRWRSTSVPEEKWSSPVAEFASAQYFVNNLLSPVLFAEALLKVPEDAALIEVAPHALMQAILKRALTHTLPVPLIRKDAKNPLVHLMENIGKIYLAGHQLSLRDVYPCPHLPVPAETPSLASFIKWDHRQEWDVVSFGGSSSAAEYKVEISIESDEHAYLVGHTIDGRVLFPATGYVVLVWKALCKLHNCKLEESSVTFSDVHLHQATVLSSATGGINATLVVRILLSTGEFEILNGEVAAVTGKVSIGSQETSDRKALRAAVLKHSPLDGCIKLSSLDAYKELKLRGYEYTGLFQGIHEATLDGKEGHLEWKENWISFLDTMLQFSLLSSPSRGLYLPTRIRRVIIEPKVFNTAFSSEATQKIIKVHHNKFLGVTMCAGVEIHGLKASLAPRRPPSDTPVLEEYTFVPYHVEKSEQIGNRATEADAARVLIDIVTENNLKSNFKIVHICQNLSSIDNIKNTASPIFPASEIMSSLQYNGLINAEYKVIDSASQLQVQLIEQLDSEGIQVVKTIEDQVSKADLIILKSCSVSKGDWDMKTVEEVISAAKDSTFIITDDSSLINKMKNMSWEVVSVVYNIRLHLLRKVLPVEYEVLYPSAADSKFNWVDGLKEKMLSADTHPLWLISQGETTTGLLGMFNCLRREPGGARLRCFIDPLQWYSDVDMKKVMKMDMAVNVVMDGRLGTMRHITVKGSEYEESDRAYLNVLTRGDLSSLTWLHLPSKQFENCKNMCQVHYAPLNFRDIMLASGKLPPDALPGNLAHQECVLGLEFSGMDRNGRRVMGLVAAGGLATTAQMDPFLTWEVPSEWSLQEAATVPVVYATAYYALVIRGGLKPGESVLIHAGSGGVGQAAISIALARGCQVFTTVSSEQKRQFLKQRFPQLTDDNFANSRDASFEYHIMEKTQGKGVDLVLNSLAGELLQASVRCVKEHGRFLEIGKADLANNSSLGMSVFLKNVTFHGILLDALIDGTEEQKTELQQILQEGIKEKEVKPLPLTTFTWEEAEQSFRFMASGKHIGKVLLEIVPKGTKEPVRIPAIHRTWLSPKHVYILTGGLGGLGLEIADWLLQRGARKIVLTSRKGITSAYQAMCINRWREEGNNIRVLTQDASTVDGAEKLIKESAKDGPVGGILHLAVVLQDSLLENQSPEKFQMVSHVKAEGAKSLDVASRKLCPDLHLWVTFSSVACGRGNPGQSNYGWANGVSERVAEQRRKAGLPGLAIQWGGIADVGVLASTLGNIEVGGTKPQSVRSVLLCLDSFLGAESSVVSSLCLASKSGKKSGDSGAKSLVACIANILGIRDVSKTPQDVSFGDLGLDSLMAVEVKQTLEREADLVLTTEQVRELSLGKIQEMEKGITSGNLTTETPAQEVPQSDCLPSLSSLPKTIMEAVNEDKKDISTLYLASPIHGNCSLLRDVSRNMDRRIVYLQYTSDLNNKSIKDMAASLAKEISISQPSGPIYIGGYSFGACIAFEIAKTLTSEGREVASLILLDGSHSYVAAIIDVYRSKFMQEQTHTTGELSSEEQSRGETESLILFAMQSYPVDAFKLRQKLQNLKTWDEKVAAVTEAICASVKVEPQKSLVEEISEAASLFYQRLLAGFTHRTQSQQIAVPTMLIRAKNNSSAKSFGDDYGLRKVVSKELRIEEVEGSHETFVLGTNGQQVAEFMKDFLHKL